MTPHALAIQTVEADRSAAIVEDYRSGAHVLAVLAKHRIGNGTLQRVLRMHKVAPRGSGRPAPKPIDEAKAAAIAKDYRDGTNASHILKRHKIGTKTLHRVLRDRGVKQRGRAPLAWSVDTDPATPKVIAMRRSGALNMDICAALQIGKHRCKRIIDAIGMRMTAQQSAEARSWRAKRARGGVSIERLASLPPSKWDEWRKEGAALRCMADEVGVARTAITAFARRNGITLPVYVRKPRPRQQPRPVALPRPVAAIVPTVAVARAQAPSWTWFDYVEITGKEFATPHHLRQGPVIKAWLEAHKVKP